MTVADDFKCIVPNLSRVEVVIFDSDCGVLVETRLFMLGANPCDVCNPECLPPNREYMYGRFDFFWTCCEDIPEGECVPRASYTLVYSTQSKTGMRVQGVELSEMTWDPITKAYYESQPSTVCTVTSDIAQDSLYDLLKIEWDKIGYFPVFEFTPCECPEGFTYDPESGCCVVIEPPFFIPPEPIEIDPPNDEDPALVILTVKATFKQSTIGRLAVNRWDSGVGYYCDGVTDTSSSQPDIVYNSFEVEWYPELEPFPLTITQAKSTSSTNIAFEPNSTSCPASPFPCGMPAYGSMDFVTWRVINTKTSSGIVNTFPISTGTSVALDFTVPCGSQWGAANDSVTFEFFADGNPFMTWVSPGGGAAPPPPPPPPPTCTYCVTPTVTPVAVLSVIVRRPGGTSQLSYNVPLGSFTLPKVCVGVPVGTDPNALGVGTSVLTAGIELAINLGIDALLAYLFPVAGAGIAQFTDILISTEDEFFCS